jgi:hypothetical protein
MRTGMMIISGYVRRARCRINAFGFASNLTFPAQKASVGLKFFDEFADRSTYQGFSLQFSGSISF